MEVPYIPEVGKIQCISHQGRYLQVALAVKNLPANSIPGQEDTQEEGMATHSSILAWRIPRTEEPGRLKFKELQRVRHN